ncbi:hypothetical protein [Streptomyces sp. NPDC058614]|uniref:hypothetical protein n=1 Tax=Streptomyces sp. NPDC058614 TaxID=3346557 RepID=UPI00364F3144
MEEQTEVIELEGKGFDPTREIRRMGRVRARADLLHMYLKQHDGERFTQAELCKALALGMDGRHLTEAVKELETREVLRVDRSKKPHTYELI